MISPSFARRSPCLALLLSLTASCTAEDHTVGSDLAPDASTPQLSEASTPRRDSDSSVKDSAPTETGSDAHGSDAHGSDAHGTDEDVDAPLPPLPTPPCTNGNCPVVLWSGASGAGGTAGLTVSADTVYWSNVPWDVAAQEYGGYVLSVPITGGSASTLATLKEFDLPVVAPIVDSNNLYWAIQSGGGIAELPLGGGTPATILAGTLVTGLALDNGNLYEDEEVQVTHGATVSLETQLLRVPVSGGSQVTLATVPYSGPAGTEPQGGGVTLDAANIYWEDITAYNAKGAVECDGECIEPAYSMLVLSTPIAGGTVTTLASTKMADGDQDATLSIAVDASNVYFVDDGSIVSVPLTGGGVETTIASSPPILGSFAFDGESFYWLASSGSDGSTGIVAKVAKSGGAVTTVFSVPDAQMLACAVDGTSVYALYTLSGVATGADPNTVAGLVKITPK